MRPSVRTENLLLNVKSEKTKRKRLLFANARWPLVEVLPDLPFLEARRAIHGFGQNKELFSIVINHYRFLNWDYIAVVWSFNPNTG